MDMKKKIKEKKWKSKNILKCSPRRKRGLNMASKGM